MGNFVLFANQALFAFSLFRSLSSELMFIRPIHSIHMIIIIVVVVIIMHSYITHYSLSLYVDIMPLCFFFAFAYPIRRSVVVLLCV